MGVVLNGWGGGEVKHFAAQADGSGVVLMHLDKAYGRGNRLSDWESGDIRATRSFLVDYSERSGAPALFAVADQLAGPGGKTWTMHIAGEVTIDGSRFTIKGAGGATMAGVFAAPADVKLSVEKGSETHALRTTGDGEFFVVMVVGKDRLPELRVEGQGADLSVKAGSQTLCVKAGLLVLK